jgi:hypothetical protein
MDRKIVLAVLAATLLGTIGIMLLMPPAVDESVARLPWKVSRDPQGHTQVLGFTLGISTLSDVRKAFGEDGKINLFARPDRGDPYAIEAYFDQVYLNRLRADLVMTLDVPQDEAAGMYDRGLRISQLESGAKKIDLAPADAARLAAAPIRAITYLPWKHLDAEVIERRFGKPSERVSEKSGVTHWLYPAKTMDIARDPKGDVVIQYVNPGDFSALVKPLDPASANGPRRERPGAPAAKAASAPAASH